LPHLLILAADEVGEQVIGHKANDCAVAVAVDQGSIFIRFRALLGILGEHRRFEVARLKVTDDGIGFTQAHPVDIQHRHLAEGVTRQMFGLLGFAFQHVDRHLIVSHALAGQHAAQRAHIGGTVEPKESCCHDILVVHLSF